MKLRAKLLRFETRGKYIAFISKLDAEKLGIYSLDRIILSKGGKEIIAIVDITTALVSEGEIGVNEEISRFFGLKLGDEIKISLAPIPESVEFIRQKILGQRLDGKKMKAIVKDVVEKHLSDIEMSAFVTALHMHGLSIDEAYNLSEAMIATGKRLDIKAKVVVDKHSIGGIPGDKTSLLVVPIVAAAGLTIPKTSSRAITSPAGTADRMEVLAPVNHTIDEIKTIVKKAGGCLVWGGALDLAPADDAFIKIEYPLGIDPLLLPSIMSKKHSIGAKFLVLDLPTGRGSKIKTIGDAHSLSEQFILLGKKMDMNVSCAITFGEQPLGYYIGPALEAYEALLTVMNKSRSYDLIEKSTQLAGMLFEATGKAKPGQGKRLAMDILKSGKAEKKLREIIALQGGNEKIKPGDMPIGSYSYNVKAMNEGQVFWIKNADIVHIARAAGAPYDKGAGIKLFAKMGDKVKSGQTIMTIYSSNEHKLDNAAKIAEETEFMVIGKSYKEKMLIDRVPTTVIHKKTFMLER